MIPSECSYSLPKISSCNSRLITEVSQNCSQMNEEILPGRFARMMKKLKLKNRQVQRSTFYTRTEPETTIDIEDNPKLKCAIEGEKFLNQIFNSYNHIYPMRSLNSPNIPDNENKEINQATENEKNESESQAEYTPKEKVYLNSDANKYSSIEANKRYSQSNTKNKNHKYGFEQFGSTNYSTKDSMKIFFNKYQQFNKISIKHPINKITPSIAFIQSSKKNLIVPNPLGLVKRKGQEHELEMNNQKVGDTYVKVLSDALKYRETLTKIKLGNNRISLDGAKSLFKTLNENKNLIYKLRILDLSYNNLGNKNLDEMIAFLSEEKCSIENLNVFSNNLGDQNVTKICDVLAKYGERRMVYLDIGKNNFGDEVVKSIVNFLKTCQGLRVFCMNQNWVHNSSAAQIINVLKSHYELRILDLSWNCIGDDLTIVPSFEEVVNTDYKNPTRNFNNFALNETLRTNKLTLRSNPLLPPVEAKGPKKDSKKKDDAAVAVEIKEPKKIPEKKKGPSTFAVALSEYFVMEEPQLVHLDISHNNLNTEDCILISEKVKENHKILGIHVDGNEMEIDNLGFIYPIFKDKKKTDFFAKSQIYYEISRDYTLRKSNIENLRKLRNKNKCWICDGFREVQFKFIPKTPIENPNNHLVKIHLNFDNYKPFDMLCLGNRYEIVRMCPPGEINYFFTLDTIPVEEEGEGGINEMFKIENKQNYIKYTYDSEYMEEYYNIREKLLYQKKQESEGNQEGNQKPDESQKIDKENPETNAEEQKTEGDPAGLIKQKDNEEKSSSVNPDDPFSLDVKPKKIDIIAKTISKISVKVNKSVINEDYRKTIKYTEPRPEKILNKFIKPRTPWTFPVSIWAYYGYDYDDVDELYLDKCFQFDFDRCQFNKEFKDNEYEELKILLRERYRDIIDCYKYYSSFSGFQVWQITQNNLTEFLSTRCNNFCDPVIYNINNAFIAQNTACSNKIDLQDKKNKNKNLSNNIVRHQFMNFLVKVAVDKYVTCLKTTKNHLEAFKIALEKHFDEAIKGFEYHKWRQTRYYNEQVDNFLKAYLPIIDAVYLSWAKQKGPKKKDVWMLLDEFNTLIQNIVDITTYPVRENPLVFNRSMTLQVDEIYSDKHIFMLLPQFLEALCRAVDKASPIPPSDSPDEWPMEKRVNQPLVNKLENIVPILISLITHPDYKTLKEKFPIPIKDFSTGLYNINYDSPFYQGYIIKTNPAEQKKKRCNKSQILTIAYLKRSGQLGAEGSEEIAQDNQNEESNEKKVEEEKLEEGSSKNLNKSNEDKENTIDPIEEKDNE